MTMSTYKITKVSDNLPKKKSNGMLYAEEVMKMHDPIAEINWLFHKLPKEEQENLIEIFDLNFQDNE
jgi:hypothetical protein